MLDHTMPITPKDAATVIVLRDDGPGLQVFCVLRHKKSSFMGGALVFPGGKVDPSDAQPQWDDRATPPIARTKMLETELVSARTLAIAACRETLEEAAILPVDGTLDDNEIASMSTEMSHGLPLWAALEQRNLRLALDQLVPWARWITPEVEAQRFDARFFLLPLPAGQFGRHDNVETTMGFWAAPTLILDQAVRGQFFLAPPTLRTLEMLHCVTDIASALALAEDQTLLPICPRAIHNPDVDSLLLVLPGDPLHEVKERRTTGSTRFVWRDSRFISDEDAG